jgi:hypothetical protein
VVSRVLWRVCGLIAALCASHRNGPLHPADVWGLRSASTTQFIANAAPLAFQSHEEPKFEDSLLEESGFEPLVPARWTTRSRPSLSPGSHSHSCLRDQLVYREGPTVRNPLSSASQVIILASAERGVPARRQSAVSSERVALMPALL